MSTPPFEVRLQPEALDQFRALDAEVRRRVREKMTWLAENAGEIRHLPLQRDLAGLHKRRIGSYRILYGLVVERRIVVIHAIGHRRDVYEMGG